MSSGSYNEMIQLRNFQLMELSFATVPHEIISNPEKILDQSSRNFSNVSERFVTVVLLSKWGFSAVCNMQKSDKFCS